MEWLVRENVIKMLERCVMPHGDGCTQECEYHGRIECCRQVMRNTLALLKAQEPKLVTNIHKEHNNVLNPNVPWVGKCPKCGKKIEGRNLTRFCKFCGQAVKWE